MMRGYVPFVLALLLASPAAAEVTGNVLPPLSEFTTSGSTTSSTTQGCTAGEFCTGNASNGGGTYTSTFDVPLTAGEVRGGLDLNSAVTVYSHPSNASLATCATLTQSGDCRDIFRLGITLFDGTDVAADFLHEVELDFSGDRDFTFTDVIPANDFGVLTGQLSLFGIDAGFFGGFFGPQFADPSLSFTYQAVVEQQILDQIAQTTEIVTAALAPPPPPVEIATIATAAPAPAATTTISTVEIQPPASPPPPPTIEQIVAPAPPEQQQAEAAVEATVEAEIEVEVAEVEAEPEPEVAAPVQVVAPQKTRREKVKAAAQRVVKKIAPSQRYSAASQTTTMVAMNLISGKIATGVVIQDAAAATFFSADNIPDGPSMVDRMANYKVFGQANGAHNALVESQWRK